MDYVVETRGLTKKFGKETVVNQLDMKIRKGEVYGFLGPNGAGKTTTIRMLLGLLKQTSGSTYIFQKNLQHERINILKKVGSLVENPSYYPHLTAKENLETLRKILGAPKERIQEVLDIVNLTYAANKKVKSFSLGMKQRLGIASALLNNPELLILDEPTNGLDPSGIIEIRHLIKELATEHGITIIISSHLLSEIEQIATTVGIVMNGNMIFQDSIEVLQKLANPKIILKVREPEQAWRVLLSSGIKADFENGGIYLNESSDEQVAGAIRVLVENDYSIYRVEEEKHTLEDIFLQMTKESNLI